MNRTMLRPITDNQIRTFREEIAALVHSSDRGR